MVEERRTELMAERRAESRTELNGEFRQVEGMGLRESYDGRITKT
jgi:hypothetical protein